VTAGAKVLAKTAERHRARRRAVRSLLAVTEVSGRAVFGVQSGKSVQSVLGHQSATQTLDGNAALCVRPRRRFVSPRVRPHQAGFVTTRTRPWISNAWR